MTTKETTAPGTGPGPSAKDIEADPGLAPEAFVRGESLHKNSTDRTAEDLVDDAGAKDVWMIEADAILVRADDEDAAVGKFTGGLGVAFDTRNVTARNATRADLEKATGVKK